MAAKDDSRGSQELFLGRRFWPMLSYACGELCVIILLYVAALASYAATRLARVCGLRQPCILCTRLDRALHGKPWFSSDLVCAAHRSEVSSLVYCKSHDQLVARSGDLCKPCLLACAAVGAGDDVNVNVNVNSRSTSAARSRRSSCSCCSSDPFRNNARSTLKHSEAVESWDTSSVPADHRQNEKTFVAGIEEVHEPADVSPGSHGQSQSRKDNANGGSGTTAKPNYRSAAPTRIAIDRNVSVKNASFARVNLASPRPSEIISARDSNSTTKQEVKALLSQMSSVRGLDSSSSEGSPNTLNEESNPASKRLYLERNYSVLEPSDGSLTDDVAEGETSLESVKKQLELNKKSMAALYKELEEERSASAIAASQTMAMINRLQEEKAAMQMEALQYLRMMEQQADHDHLAIQDLHDLLTEREKELLDLDAELAHCRRILQNDPFNGDRLDGTDTMNNTVDGRDPAFEFLNGADFAESAMSHLEDDKAYILDSLSRLEENVGIYTNRLASGDATNSQQDILFEDHTNADGSPSNSDKLSGVASLKTEISLLNIRLRALQEDQEFLKQVLSSLQCGSDGLQCIQEITSHLADLRRVVTH